MAAAVPFTDKEIDDLRDVFSMFDVNKDGERVSVIVFVETFLIASLRCTHSHEIYFM